MLASDPVIANEEPSRRTQSRAPLAVAMLGFFVVALDAQIVNVALPDIGDALGGGLSGLQWVVTGYTLTFSSLLLFAGTLSDRVGARRAYALGMGTFVLASGVCGFAPSLGVLVAARVAQGVGAALITPTSLALIREAYDDAKQRAKAVAYWALGGSVAAAAGPILGGILTEVDWRIIFFINLPVGVLAIALLTRVAESPRRPHPFDIVGQLAALVALVGLTYAVIEGGSQGTASRRSSPPSPPRSSAPPSSCSPRSVVGTRWCRSTSSAPDRSRSPWPRPLSPWPASTAWCSCRASTSRTSGRPRRWRRVCCSCR